MTKLLLTIHVLAAIVAIGPVTVAASMYPVATRRADLPTLRVLHRITRVYAALAVVIPAFGLATATSMGVLTDPWLLTSIALTVVAAAVLGLQILPRQARILATTDSPDPERAHALPAEAYAQRAEAPAQPQADDSAGRPPGSPTSRAAELPALARRLGMVTGMFNLLWAVVVVLMIVRPGSSTGT